MKTAVSVAKRQRYFMRRNGTMLYRVLKNFSEVIGQNPKVSLSGRLDCGKAALQIGAVAFMHQFSSSLNGPVHFHVCLVDGVFEAVSGHSQANDVTDATPLFWCAQTQFSTQGRMTAFAEPV